MAEKEKYTFKDKKLEKAAQNPEISDSLKKFYEDLDKQTIVFRVSDTPTEKGRFSLKNARENLFMSPPAFLVVVCKILNPVFTIGGFVFLIGGGLYCLFAAYNLLTAFNALGWHGLLSEYTLHIVLYVALVWLIKTIRYWIYRILKA